MTLDGKQKPEIGLVIDVPPELALCAAAFDALVQSFT